MFEFSAAIRSLLTPPTASVCSFWLGKGHVVDESGALWRPAFTNRFCGSAQGAGSPVVPETERPVQHHGERSLFLLQPELLGDGLAPIPPPCPLRPCLLAG